VDAGTHVLARKPCAADEQRVKVTAEVRASPRDRLRNTAVVTETPRIVRQLGSLSPPPLTSED
jgi:hypothetical protein